MNMVRHRPFGQRYAFVVAGVIFVCLLAGAGLRAAPGVMLLPIESAFGWSRDTISFAAAVGIFLYGLTGPFAAALMQSFGIRRTLIGALILMSLSTGVSVFMSEPWQYVMTWGVFSGVASGAVAMVLGATIVNRWFVTNRGLMMGLLTASTATGTLIFLPGMAALAEWGGWQAIVITVAIVSAALVPVAYFLVPEGPQEIGQQPYGARPGDEAPPRPRGNVLGTAFSTLFEAARTKTFWFLFATFFICGFTTNGLVGTHMIAFCGDMGMPAIQAASLLAIMGIFDLIGTTASGWLTDRFDPRKLLFVYYGLRGISLMFLPFTDFNVYSLSIFAVFYGLDWIATVPPTVRLANEAFGDRKAPIVFGWIAAGHQIGAASAAYLAGYMRTVEGNYFNAFLIAGATGVLAALLSLLIGRRRTELQPAIA
jgi:predicted MFS family arabinose efflux permease